MPAVTCRVKGRAGKKWGAKGKCYTGPNADKKANKQAAAAYANGYRGK